jgi:hypothetical protein
LNLELLAEHTFQIIFLTWTIARVLIWSIGSTIGFFHSMFNAEE